MYIRNDTLGETRLGKCLRSPISEHPSTVKMLKGCKQLKCLRSPILEHPLTVNILKGPKHLRNLHDKTFIKFFHHSERN